MELIKGFYSIYYKCPNCYNRFTTHDAATINKIEKQGVFQQPRMRGFVIYNNNIKMIYARRNKKNGYDV